MRKPWFKLLAFIINEDLGPEQDKASLGNERMGVLKMKRWTSFAKLEEMLGFDALTLLRGKKQIKIKV